MGRDDDQGRDDLRFRYGETSREASSAHGHRERSRSRSRDRGSRGHRYGSSQHRRRRSPTPPRRHYRGYRPRSRSRDRDKRRRRRSRSADSDSEYGGYVPRHRRPTGSFGRDDVRGKAGVSVSNPRGLGSQEWERESVAPQMAAVDPAAAQAERQRQAQRWILEQQAAGFRRLKEQSVEGLGGNKKNKEIYVGNLLVGVVNADALKSLFNSSLAVAFPNENPLVKPVAGIQMSSDMKYAFIQLQTEEMATAAIQLNGMELCGRPLTIARPSGWVDPSLAAVVAAKAANLLASKEASTVTAVSTASAPVAPGASEAAPAAL